MGYIQLGRKTAKVVVSVKGGGNAGPDLVRDLGGTMDTEGSDFGILTLLAEPTRKMTEAAAKYGQFSTPVGNIYDQLQIWTIRQYFADVRPRLPALADFLAKAPRQRTGAAGRQTRLE